MARSRFGPREVPGGSACLGAITWIEIRNRQFMIAEQLVGGAPLVIIDSAWASVPRLRLKSSSAFLGIPHRSNARPRRLYAVGQLARRSEGRGGIGDRA